MFNASGDTSALRDFILQNPGALEAPSDYVKWLVEFLDGNYEASLNALKNWKLDVFAYQIKFFPRSLLEGLSHQYIGDEHAARLAYESALAYLHSEAPLPSNEPRMMIAYGMAHAGLGENEAAVGYARQALELVTESREQLQAPYYEQDVIFLLSMAGDDDAAIAQLSAYLAEPSTTTLAALRADPRIERLESQADFHELVKESESRN